MKRLWFLAVLLVLVIISSVLYMAYKPQFQPSANTSGANFSITPSTVTGTLNQEIDFSVTLDSAGQALSAAQFEISYDPAAMEIIDADTAKTGLQVTQGNIFDAYIVNFVSSGKITVAAIALNLSSFTGSGVFASFKAKAISQKQSNLAFNLNTTKITGSDGTGNNILGFATGTTINIAFNLNLSVNFQARNLPDMGGVSLSGYEAGQTTPVLYKENLTINSGQASIIVSELQSSGNYDFKITAPYYLSKKITNQNLGVSKSLNFGVLSAGDLNLDNFIDISDFAILKGDWGTGEILSDLNNDGIVDISDFAIMKFNWNKSGE